MDSPGHGGPPAPSNGAGVTASWQSISELVYQTLRREISHGVYRPGVVRIGVIADRFGISPTPVREALRKLESEGLVTLRNRRVTVRALSREELREIFALRMVLESFAMEAAASGIQNDPSLVSRLDALLISMDTIDRDQPDSWREANQEFHMLIYRAAGMHRLTELIETLWVAVEPYMRLYVHAEPRLEESQAEHRRILDAVRHGASSEGARVLREHLAATGLAMERGLAADERN